MQLSSSSADSYLGLPDYNCDSDLKAHLGIE